MDNRPSKSINFVIFIGVSFPSIYFGDEESQHVISLFLLLIKFASYCFACYCAWKSSSDVIISSFYHASLRYLTKSLSSVTSTGFIRFKPFFLIIDLRKRLYIVTLKISK